MPRVTIISCIRLALLVNWFNQFYKGQGTKDIYYTFGWAISPIECNLAIIAASIPALWPLLRKAFPNFYSDMGYSYRVNTQPGASNHATGGLRSSNMPRSQLGRSNKTRPTATSNIDDDSDDAYMMKSIHANGQVDCRATTPTGSQDGIIDFKDGIVRTTDVEVAYEEASKDQYPHDRDEYSQKKVAYAV
jgi:hypothetical protein